MTSCCTMFRQPSQLSFPGGMTPFLGLLFAVPCFPYRILTWIYGLMPPHLGELGCLSAACGLRGGSPPIGPLLAETSAGWRPSLSNLLLYGYPRQGITIHISKSTVII